MLETDLYTLPNQAGEKLILGQFISITAMSIECANITNSYLGPILIVTPDMQIMLQMRKQIQQFTKHPVFTLPDWKVIPYENFSPHRKVISDRIMTLYQIPTLKRGIVILPVNVLMQLICPYNFFKRYTLLVTKGQQLSQKKLSIQLEQIGYHKVSKILECGEFTTHNKSLDLYSIGNKNPCRIDFLNNNIHRLNVFDINTQCAFREIHYINILPTHEFPIGKNAVELFCKQWQKQFNIDHETKNIYKQLINRILPVGIEYWQPLFFSEPLVPLFNYLPLNTLVVNVGDIKTVATSFWENTNKRFNYRIKSNTKSLLPPETLWLCVEDLLNELKCWPLIHLNIEKIKEKTNQYNVNYRPLPDLAIEKNGKKSIDKLHKFCNKFNGSIILLLDSKGRYESIKELLSEKNIFLKLINKLEDVTTRGVYTIIGTGDKGFIDNFNARALICDSDLLNNLSSYYQQQKNQNFINNGVLIKNLDEIYVGQLVVHLKYGIGRYVGMTVLDVGGIKNEYLVLIYANDDKLYVPVSSLNLVSRYIGGITKNVPLSKLGSNNWIQARQKANEQIYDIAASLLDIYAQRHAKNGFAFCFNQENYKLFCEEFPFTTTTDQAKAINAVINDMCQPLAMDRLVCGDVGFGKTEVAMRAAFLAIENQKQVAVLVPTTLLARQHFDSFRDRFINWPVNIDVISRFRSLKEQTQILEQTAKGKVNILIGTHKLLQDSVKWHDLGLLIVDEEHRFGVHHKERIRAIKSNIDILTLTATPIPRTLNMAISGIRDLSIINTPPARRLAVKTFVCEYGTVVIREAIMREVLRGGQVYYIYNDIKNIERIAHYLEIIVPEVRIAIGHGQLRECDLEKVIDDFYHQRFDVLVCTTIIETGIDITNVNTIIIEMADRFGLAQLHQLRGRVGRSHHQAYAYLLTTLPKILSKDAYKRLEAIASQEDLGAGFSLAMQDLEIRGAGELLGKDQSGQIETIGFSLYMELLKKAVSDINSGCNLLSLEDLNNQLTEVELHTPLIIPEKYIPNVNTRLYFYKRIAKATNEYEIEDLKVELINRFGILPDSVNYLLITSHIKQLAQNLGIRRIKSNNNGGFIEFNKTNYVNPTYLINLLTSKPNTYRLDSPTCLRFICDLKDYKIRLNYINKLLEEFQQHTLIV